MQPVLRVLHLSALPPGEHNVGVGIVGAGTGGAPLDGVDLFTVSLQVVNTGFLLHAPNLREEMILMSM